MGEHVKVDFGTLKANVPIAAVLDKYGVQYKQPNKEYLRADCPLPSHTSKESKGSFAVNLTKNIWCCKSTSCNQVAKKKGGDVLDFVALMEGAPVLAAAKKLVEWFPQDNAKAPASTGRGPNESGAFENSANSTPVSAKNPDNTTNQPLSFELKGIGYHAYLEARGISKDLAEKFGVGFFPGKGSMSGRVVIPIRDENGSLVAYAGRSIAGEEPRYKLPAGFMKGRVLYNRFAVSGEVVALVEGFFSCMKVSAAGFPCVALMGATLSETQEKLLDFKRVILLLDPDEAGREGVASILPRLAKSRYVRDVVPDKQPDEMTAEEIKALIRFC
jgi:DNA primase